MKIPEYVKWIKGLRCLVTGLTPCDPHHCGPFGTAKRNHDEWLVPLHRTAHTDDICNRNRRQFREKAEVLFQCWLSIIPKKRKKKSCKN